MSAAITRTDPDLRARPPVIALASRRPVLRARRLNSGGYVHQDHLATDLSSLCRAIVAAGGEDASLQVWQGRDAVAFVLSIHGTAAVTPLALERADQALPRAGRSR